MVVFSPGSTSVLGALPKKLAAREVEFEHAWERVVDYVTWMAEGLDLDQRDSGRQ